MLILSWTTISDCTNYNLFFIKNKTIFTPPITDGGVDGIGRKLVMQLIFLAQQNAATIQRDFNLILLILFYCFGITFFFTKVYSKLHTIGKNHYQGYKISYCYIHVTKISIIYQLS